jgi:octaprenyl-diphosphate synthase
MVLLLFLYRNIDKMISISKISQPIQQELSEFRNLFELSLRSDNPLLQRVSDHILAKKGKMMRPILIMLVAKLHGRVEQATLYTAVSLELLHTASLVHDDVVDDSKERRGQKSVNAIFDNRIAVLSGDYILATSLNYASKTNNIDIISVVSRLGCDLSDGELLQLENIDKTVFLEADYYQVIRKKTAALFSACAMTGSLSVSDDTKFSSFAFDLGDLMGICFQIRDDIFDYYDEEKIGKPTHQDMLEGKLTLPALYVLNNFSDIWLHDVALRIKSGNASLEEIKKLSDFVISHGGIEYAEQKMNEFHQQALDMLFTLPDSEIRASLIAYLDYIVGRDI